MCLKLTKGPSLLYGHEFKVRLVCMAEYLPPATFNCMGTDTGWDLTRIVVLQSKERGS